MSANGLPVFDKTLQTTNIWLDQIMERIGPDRQSAWKVLSTFHATCRSGPSRSMIWSSQMLVV